MKEKGIIDSCITSIIYALHSGAIIIYTRLVLDNFFQVHRADMGIHTTWTQLYVVEVVQRLLTTEKCAQVILSLVRAAQNWTPCQCEEIRERGSLARALTIINKGET
jgi:hypothetical protein